MKQTTTQAKPFLKWAGGKTQLLDNLTKGLPRFSKYCELMQIILENSAMNFGVKQGKSQFYRNIGKNYYLLPPEQLIGR